MFVLLSYIYIRKQTKIIMKTEYRLIIGFTDSVNQCDCCGKTDLKGTYCVIIEGNELYYGSTCIKNNLSISSNSDLSSEIKKTTELNKSLARKKYSSIGGKSLEEKLSTIDFSLPEWDSINEKVIEIKKELCIEFRISNF